MIKWSIIIPAYNEEKRITVTLEDYCSYFRSWKDVELLVVLNGCHDHTLQIVKKFSRRFSFLRYVDIPDAIGKGGAVLEGFRLAQGSFIGFVDADNATPVASFVSLMDGFMGDGVIASRRLPESLVYPQQSFLRRSFSLCFNVLVRTLLFLPYHDTQCGAKLFTRDATMFVIDKLTTTRWAFDVDLLFVLHRNGFIVHELPTEWHDIAGSQLNVGKVSRQMFLAVLRLRLVYSPLSFVVDWYNRVASVFSKD